MNQKERDKIGQLILLLVRERFSSWGDIKIISFETSPHTKTLPKERKVSKQRERGEAFVVKETHQTFCESSQKLHKNAFCCAFEGDRRVEEEAIQRFGVQTTPPFVSLTNDLSNQNHFRFKRKK